MNNNQERTPWYRPDRVVVLALIFVLGIVLILVGENLSGVWSDFVGSVGVALITTAILGAVLESQLKERLFADIKKEVAETLSAIQAQAIDAVQMSRLPIELLSAIRKTMTQAAIIERDIVAIYEFTDVTIGRAKALKVEITTSSIFENLTDQFQHSEIFQGGVGLPARLKRYSATDDAGFTRVETEIIHGTSTPAPFILDRPATQLHVLERNGAPQFRRPIEFSPRCRLRVTTSEIAYYGVDDWDFFAVTNPSINITVNARFPDGYKLRGYPDDALLEYWDGHDDDGQWYVGGGLLPGQGINFEWEPLVEERENRR